MTKREASALDFHPEPDDMSRSAQIILGALAIVITGPQRLWRWLRGVSP